jgi:Flp pilus assembly protein TadG
MSAWIRSRLTGDPERGAITPMVVVVGVALLLMVGLVVDAGAKLNAVSQANDVAAQAAHAAATQLDTGAALSAGQIGVSASQAQQAGLAVLAASDMSGSVVIDGQSVTVTATCTKPTAFLSLIGITTVEGTGTASVRIATGGEQP